MAFHSFDLNLPSQNNETDFLIDLNTSPTRESLDDALAISFHEEQKYHSPINLGIFFFIVLLIL